METIIQKINSGFIFWLTALSTFIIWWLVYANLDNLWTDPESLKATDWGTLTSQAWNNVLSNQNVLSGSLQDTNTKVNTLSWRISSIDTSIANTWKFASLSYKLLWTGGSSTWKCAKVLIPEQCVATSSSDFWAYCNLHVSYWYHWWTWNWTNNWAARNRAWGRKVYFLLAPHTKNASHYTWYNRLLWWHTSGWSTRRTYTTGSAAESGGIGGWYVEVLWREEWSACDQYSRSYNANPNKNPREVILAVRNDFDAVVTIEYPISKSNEFFDWVY